MKNTIRIALSVGTLVGIVFLVGLYTHETTAHQALAEEVVAECAEAEHRPSCYDFAIPKLMDRGLSMEEAFAVTRHVQELDPSYFYCHVLGHYLSGKETAKDPSKWKDVVARAPSGICSNGAIHGAFQERFRAESLPDASLDEFKAELDGICEARQNWDPTGLEQATCTHALGHLTMYATGADINKSLALCDEIALHNNEHDFRQLCYDGAFMQLFQPLEPEDFALIEGKEIKTREEAVSFCDQFGGAYRASCITESWPLWRVDLMENPQEAVRFCDRLEGEGYQEWRCYNAVFYVLTALSGLDSEWVVNYCSSTVPERRGQCFAHAASRLVEVDWRNTKEALGLCQEASHLGVGDSCYRELVFYASYNFKEGTDEFEQLCSGLPESYQKRCFERNPEPIATGEQGT